MEADFARYYGLDFADYYRGRLSLRQVRNRLRWLPADSAVAQIERDQAEKAEAQRQADEVDAALAPFKMTGRRAEDA